MEAQLVAQVAYDGETGVSFKDFTKHVEAAHREHAEDGAPAQLVDDAFVDYTWRNLVQSRDDLRVGYVQKKAVADVPELLEEEGDGELPTGKKKPKSLKGRGRTALLGSGRQKDDDLEFIELDEDERLLPRAELSEKYGKALRIAATPDACWYALTCRHDRPTKLTQFVYAILESITRKRGEGITMVELGRQYVHDQKSLFHFVKVLVEFDIVKKIKSNFKEHEKASNIHTSRMIHRHFLESSEAWRVSAEAAAAAEEAAEPDDKDEAEEDAAGAAASKNSTTWQPITREHFFTNAQVVINRLKHVLRNAPDQMLPHTDLIHAIKMTDTDVKDRKKLNRVIDKLCRDGEFEKVSASGVGREKDSSIHCVRLVDGAGMDQDDKIEPEASADELNAQLGTQANVPQEWQILSLIKASGADGMTLRDLGHAMAIIDVRGIEAMLSRLENQPPPAHLADLCVRSVMETKGRLKRTRYFTMQGYSERCDRDGIKVAEPKHPIEDPAVIGGFSTVTSRFFSNMAELHQATGELSLEMNKMPPKPKKPRQSKPKGSASAASTPGPARGTPDGEVAPVVPKKRGRPRKTPAEGEEAAPAKPKKGKPALDENGNPIAKKRGRPKKEPGAPKSKYERKRNPDGSYKNRPPGSRHTQEEWEKIQAEQRANKAEEQDELDDDDDEDAPPVKKRRTTKAPRIIDSAEPDLIVVDKEESPEPPVASTSAVPASAPDPAPDTEDLPPPPPVKRGRGRPRKHPLPPPTPDGEQVDPPPKRPRGRPRKNPLPPSSPVEGNEEDIVVEVDELEEPDAGPTGPAAGEERMEIDVDAASTKTTPIPASVPPTPQQPPTPAQLPTPARPAQLKSDTTPAPAPRAPKSRIPHTQIVRESELLALITQKGGIAVNWQNLRQDHLDFVKETKGEAYASANPIDKLSIDRIIKSMVGRNVMCREFITQESSTGQNIRHDVLYLPTIERNSEQMEEFLLKLRERAVPQESYQWNGRRTKVDIKVRRNQPLRQRLQLDLTEETSDEDVRKICLSQWRIVAQYYGFAYGRMARARVLHCWMVEYLLANAGSGDDLVMPFETIITEMPVAVFVKIFPLSHEDEELIALLDTEEGRNTPIREVAASVRQVLQYGRTKPRTKILEAVEQLRLLLLVEPMHGVKAEDGETELEGCEMKTASHFQLCRQLPLYDFVRNKKDFDRPLVQIIELSSTDAVETYWTQLHAFSMRKEGDNDPVPMAADAIPESLPATFSGSSKICKDASKKVRWEDTQQLMNDQLEWLRWNMGEDPQALAEDEKEVARMAHILFARPEAVARWLREDSTRKKRGRPRRARGAAGKAAEEVMEEDDEEEEEEEEEAVSSSPEPEDSPQERAQLFDDIVKRRGKESKKRMDSELARNFKSWWLSSAVPIDALQNKLDGFFGPRAQSGDVEMAEPKRPQAARTSKSKTKTAATATSKSGRPTRTSKAASGDILHAVPFRQPSQQRLRWNNESIDKFRDAIAITRARSTELGSKNQISWDVVASVFPGRAVNQLRQQMRSLQTRAREVQYLAALQSAWTEVWKRERGTEALPDRYPTSLNKYDLDAHIAYLNVAVDKSKLRTDDFFAAADTEIDLPADLGELTARWEVERHDDRIARQVETECSNYWLGNGVRADDRLSGVASQAFSTSLTPSVPLHIIKPAAQGLQDSILACKLFLSTPYSANNSGEAKELFDQVDAEKALDYLASMSMTKKTGAGKQKHHEYSEKFKVILNDPILENVDQLDVKLADAEDGYAWPLILDEPQMVALCQQFARAELEIEIDLSQVHEALEDIGFNARKGDDETIETSLIVKPVAAKPASSRQHYQPPSIKRGVISKKTSETHGHNLRGELASCAKLAKATGDEHFLADCTGCITDSEQRAQQSGSPTLNMSVYKFLQMDVVMKGSSDGIDLALLESRALSASIPASDIAGVLDALTTVSPPVLLKVGHDKTRIVSALHLSAWTVVVTSDDGRKDLRVLPRMWLDLDGDLVDKIWQGAARAVLKMLSENPGSTVANVYNKLQPAFERLEVVDVLDQLVSVGSVVARSVRSSRQLSIDNVRYFLSSEFRW